MSRSNNPFERLNVKRDADDDDEQGEFQKVKGKEKNVPVGLEQKKKKARPVEKVEDDGEEGFTEVSKKVKKHRPENDDEEETKGGEHKKRKGINYNTAEEKEYRTKDKPKRGRQYDRQSGTGRGKEIAKGGAGGKGTWGENPKNIARDFENNNDDFYFDQALNPEKKKDRPPRKPKKEDKKEGEEKEGEEKKDEKEGEDKKEDEQPKRRKFEPKPLTEEEKLDRPKDAQSLEDYLKKQKKPKEEEEKKEVKRIQDGDPLKKREEQKVEILGTTGTGKKKGKKKKEKEINKEEFNLNAQIGANLEISGANDRERRPRPRKKGKKEKENENKFVFNEEDFPEL